MRKLHNVKIGDEYTSKLVPTKKIRVIDVKYSDTGTIETLRVQTVEHPQSPQTVGDRHWLMRSTLSIAYRKVDS